MDRNQKFYNQSDAKKYFIDIVTHKNKNFINYLNSLEISLIKDYFHKDFHTILILGMGWGREIDWLKKIYPHSQIDVIDYSEPFINFGKLIYKDVNFSKIDLNDVPENFNFGEYDLILSLNTLEYLNQERGMDLIMKVCKKMKKDSNFIFRLQNKNFFMSPLIERSMNNRKQDMSETFLYEFDYVLKSLSNLNVNITTIKAPIHLYGLDFLYSFLWNVFSYFEIIIRILMPKKYCSAIYFKCSKKCN